MSAVVSYNLQLAVREGRLDEFRSLMEEMVESTRAEAGARTYEWLLGEDGSAVLDGFGAVDLGEFGGFARG